MVCYWFVCWISDQAFQVQALARVIVSLFLNKTFSLSPFRSMFGCCQIFRFDWRILGSKLWYDLVPRVLSFASPGAKEVANERTLGTRLAVRD